ncbi:MAG: lytic transglycosylase domain-containing protein [Hydrogenophaga sp.]|uniref:lytic transglycosylase domain-containing protein n=1 Tax=Hydrogenophaga sp. TaxID=1904254 RepID=UPI00262C8225|nr:lytic transglycosylase domain-containing protein [Hydrogenophaga sp.]MCV0439001.1 lytic transglycosylase domain-containing protein [Hydrogenophaga sp.]
MRARIASLASLCWLAAGSAFAQTEGETATLGAMPLTAETRCVVTAAERHSVNPWVLKAILKVESNFKPGAVNRNPNGSVDIGMAQINSIHLKELRKYGISDKDLLDPCVSTYVAAWHLAKQYRAHGNTWFAVGAYHSATPCFNNRYAGLVWNTLVDWKVIDSAKRKLKSLEACGFKSQPTGPSSVRVAKSSTSSLIAFDE